MIMFFIADFCHLVIDTRKTQMQAFAPGTWDNLIMQWVKFLTFCIRFRLVAMPVSDITLPWCVQYLSYSFQSHASIVNYLSGLKTLHMLLNCGILGFSGILVKLTVSGLCRKSKHQPKQALAINPIILNHIYATLDLNDPNDVTFWAVCLTSFYLLLRKSNIVAPTLTSFDMSQLLCRQDLKMVNG